MKLILEKKHVILIFVMALLGFITTFVSIEKNKGPTETQKEDIRIIDTTNNPQDAAYVKETTYKGNSLPAELFEIRFRMNADGQYLSNIELLDYLGGEDSVFPYLNTANNALMLTFAQNGLEMKEAEYREKIQDLYASSQTIQIGENSLTTSEYALSLYELYKDNQIFVEGDFETDSSLVWQSDYVYYVRGILSLSLKQDNNGAYEDSFGIPLNKQNKTLNLIVQVKFMPNNYDEILGVDILGAI